MDISRNALAGDDLSLLGAEPAGRYANERMLSDYIGSGLSGANALGAGTLAALMAADPSWVAKFFSPGMALLAAGAGGKALDQKRSGDVYRRYRDEQPD